MKLLLLSTISTFRLMLAIFVVMVCVVATTLFFSPDGERGPAGKQGEPGVAGATGEQGDTGATGERGPAGVSTQTKATP